MKVNSKQTIVLAAIISVFPLAILAAQETPGKAQEAFCNRLTAAASRLEERISERYTKIEQKKSEKGTNFQTGRQARSDKLIAARDSWDSKRAEQIAKLEAKAQTDSQKQAVAAFKEAVSAAVSARRLAVDNAITAFRTGVDQLAEQRKIALETLTANYRSEVSAALQKAKTSCASGTAAVTVRETLITELKAARDKFNTGRQEVDKIGPAVEELAKTRNQAVAAAVESYKAAIEQARVDLKAAFGTNE